MSRRIGVFICHCGANIARTVDVAEVARRAAGLPGVALAVDYRYMCSSPGQELIRQKAAEHGLDAIVVAACSPRMHEKTFRAAAAAAGINPYLAEMANIREQCSWVHHDQVEATRKAADIVRMMVAKVARNRPLSEISVPVTKRALVIGGGIAGIQAALDIAGGGVPVVLVERQPSIGGNMARLDETFPTLDCSQCILTPKMVEAAQHPLITLHTYSEIEELAGAVGSFRVTIRKKARSVDARVCTGCGDCYEKCPVKKIPSEFDAAMGRRTAIYVPFPQAVPNVPVIDRQNCLRFTKGKCGLCAKVCKAEAIHYDQEDELVTEEIGAVVVATGYDTLSAGAIPEYGAGRFADVISGIAFERLVSASGPTGGELRRPSDGRIPKSVVIIACAGSRDQSLERPYCSKICCMYSAKHAILYKHKVHDGQVTVFYMDIRAAGKGYDEFTRRAIEDEGARYVRGRVSRIYRDSKGLVVAGADTLAGRPLEVRADLVVLATAVLASPGAVELAQKLGISYDQYGFYSEAHPKLRPVEASTPGILLAGACQAPKDIPESVSQGSAAAAKALALLSSDEMRKEPVLARIEAARCIGCGTCAGACPYSAIELKMHERLRRVVAEVSQAACAGCGTCVGACPAGVPELDGFTDEQIVAQVDVLAWDEENGR